MEGGEHEYYLLVEAEKKSQNIKYGCSSKDGNSIKP